MRLPAGVRAVSYSEDRAVVRTRLQWGLLLALFVWLFTLPLYASNYILALCNLIFITAIALHGLNIVTGYCGQINIGQSAFMAVGAYISAILCTKFGLPFWLALPCAALATGMVGVLFGLPSFRVKGFYLALVTIATQFIVIFVIYHLPKYTGGIHGMTAPAPQLGSITFNTEKSYYLLTLVAAIVMTYFAKNLTRSRAGRAFIAIRDNDLAAEVMGINIHYYKLVAFFVSTVYAGVAGSLLAHYMRLLSPDYFTLLTSVWYLAVLVIGGMGSTLGPIFGAIVMRFLFEMTDYLNSAIVILAPGVATQLVTATSMMVLGLVVTVFLIYEPRGLAHRWELFKASYRLHPFSG